MIYLITDWMNHVCFNSDSEDFKSFDDASEYLDRMVEQELINDGLNPYGNNVDCPENFTRTASDEDFEEYRGEYSIEEYDESIDRIMWTGTRYVLKKDYYKAIA